MKSNWRSCVTRSFTTRTRSLDTVPGVGKILALVLLYEIHDISRFPTVQDFVSYCRLVKPKKESAGKTYGFIGAKIGNAHLKWAFSEASGAVSPQQSGGTGVRGASGKETQQRQSSDDSGSQTGARRLLHAAAQRGFRHETISEPLIPIMERHG